MVLNCAKCKYTTERKFNLDRHMKKHNTDNNIFTCEPCKFTTKEKYNFDRHCKSNKHEKKINGSKEIIYSCDIEDCKYETNKKVLLTRHKKSHDEYEIHNYKCLLCVKTFRDKERYISHSKGIIHGHKTSKLIRTIKDILNKKYPELNKNYYNELSQEKAKMRHLAFSKLDQPVKVKKNNNKRKINKKVKKEELNALIDNINIVQLWTLEEWKENYKMSEQATKQDLLLLFEQLKAIDKLKPDMQYLDTYKDDFKNIDTKTDEQIINIYSDLIFTITDDLENEE